MKWLRASLLEPERLHSELDSTIQFSSVQSLSRVSLRLHGLPPARLLCPSPTPRAYSNSCPLSPWCHPTISFFVIPFSPHLQSFPASVFSNVSVLHITWPKYWSFSFSISLSNEHPDWSPLGWTGWISLQSKGLSRVFSNTTVQKYQAFVFSSLKQ